MATTAYTAIARDKNGNMLEFNVNNNVTYKMAEQIALFACKKEEVELIAVVEQKKMYPNGKNIQKEETNVSNK